MKKLYNYPDSNLDYELNRICKKIGEVGGNDILYDTTSLETNSDGELYVVNDGHTHATQYLALDGSNSITGKIDWAGGNVTYVPLSGDIQTYVTAATAGDTLILASGTYTITATITVDKKLNIVGQGINATIISCATASVTAFNATASDVRIANLSITMTGAASKGIGCGENLSGINIEGTSVVISCTGFPVAYHIQGSSAIIRDSTFNVISSTQAPAGLFAANSSATTINAVIDCYNVTGSVTGASISAAAFWAQNINDANTITVNLHNCYGKVNSGTVLDRAVCSISTTTNNCIVNAYGCIFDGADYDAYQNGTNQLNLYDCFLVNNTTYGTITFKGANTGWSVTAGYTSDKIFNPALTNLNEVARVLGTLIDALISCHILGA